MPLVNGYVRTQLEDTSYALISFDLFCIEYRIMKYLYFHVTVHRNHFLFNLLEPEFYI